MALSLVRALGRADKLRRCSWRLCWRGLAGTPGPSGRKGGHNVLADEITFWATEDTANLDSEILAAEGGARPAAHQLYQ